MQYLISFIYGLKSNILPIEKEFTQYEKKYIFQFSIRKSKPPQSHLDAAVHYFVPIH